MMRAMKKALSALILITSAITANAQEWTQWRGPARDGAVSAKNTPTKWPETLQRVWRVEIGEGYSSPVVAGGPTVRTAARRPSRR